jgi:general secretion pathway protein K
MSAPSLQRLWRALTQPRSLRGRPHPRRRQSGVAILIVVTTLMFLTIVVTELAFGARVRLLVAAHQAERIQAQWLARTGLNFYRLVLVANHELENNQQIKSMIDSIGIPMDNLWQMVPMINTGLLRMLMGSGGDAGDLSDETLESLRTTGRVSETDQAEIADEQKTSRFNDRDWLSFDGDFMAEVKDHESRINVNAFANEGAVSTVQESPTGQLLAAVMGGEENETWLRERNLNKWELIANIKDWVDQDNLRSGGMGGYEDNLYNTLDPPYLTKNAPFDSVDELRVVAGWEGAVYDRFKDTMTVYGDPAGKVNINTIDDPMMVGLIRACVVPTPVDPQILRSLEIMAQNDPFLTYLQDGKKLAAALTQAGLTADEACITSKVTKTSQTFTITSTGMVGESSATITAVLDFSGSSNEGRLVYWRMD